MALNFQFKAKQTLHKLKQYPYSAKFELSQSNLSWDALMARAVLVPR
jgi:hypothetical protein